METTPKEMSVLLDERKGEALWFQNQKYKYEEEIHDFSPRRKSLERYTSQMLIRKGEVKARIS
jgi:hypothetical protein